MSGQVWTAADFDATRNLGFQGGAGSVLAVTGEQPGADGVWGTIDDIVSPMNERPGRVSVDANPGGNCADAGDSVRGFAGHHTGGVNFVFADGSVKFLNESLDAATYRGLSTIAGQEVFAAPID